MRSLTRRRRLIAVFVSLILLIIVIFSQDSSFQPATVAPPQPTPITPDSHKLARSALDSLDVKGRAPNTGYSRAMFGDGWQVVDGCDTRNHILARDLTQVVRDDNCKVLSGKLDDPYTGRQIDFRRGKDTSDDVQIDHVVALNDAWQKGAQSMTQADRVALANDPLELLAVDGEVNQQKSNGDAATWLPPNKPFRCQYVARQIAIKLKYKLWVTSAEREAMIRVLTPCPGQALPI